MLSGPSWSYSVPAIGTTPPNTNGIPSERRNDVPAMSKKVIVSIRDEGLSNHALNLGEKEGSVFFFNDSSSENITLSIAWGNRAAHCASENLKLEQDGSPNAVASFRIGNSSGDIPLIERSPGHYSGKYFGQPYDHFKDQPLFVTVRGRSGLITEQEIAGPSFLKR